MERVVMSDTRKSYKTVPIAALAFLVLASMLWVTGNARPGMLLGCLGGVVIGAFVARPLNSMLMKIGRCKGRSEE